MASKPAPTEAPAKPPRSLTIPAGLHGVTLQRLREINPDTLRAYNCREVAAWLAEKHGCPASSKAVQRLRAADEKYSSAQVASALREELAAAVGPTKVKLAAALRHLDELVRKSKSVRAVATGVNAYARVLREFATLGGVAAPAQVDVTSGGSPLNFYLPAKRDDDGGG